MHVRSPPLQVDGWSPSGTALSSWLALPVLIRCAPPRSANCKRARARHSLHRARVALTGRRPLPPTTTPISIARLVLIGSAFLVHWQDPWPRHSPSEAGAGADAPLHQAQAHGPQRWRCARRARPRRGANLRRRRRQSWRAQCASEVHFMSACAAAAAVRRAGAYVVMRARIRLRFVAPRGAEPYIGCVYNRTVLACACITIVSIRWRAR